MALFNTGNDDKKEQDKFWFLKAATNAAIIGGSYYGFTKMKGPAGKLVDKITSEKIQKKAEEEILKNIKTSDEFVNDFKPERADDALLGNYEVQGMDTDFSEISGLEDSLISRVDNVIDTSKAEKTSVSVQSLVENAEALSEKSKKFSEEFSLFYTKFSAIEQFIKTVGGDPKTAREILELRSIIDKFVDNGILDNSIVNRIESIHSRYINNPIYRSKYAAELNIMRRKIGNAGVSTGATEDLVKRAIYGDVSTHLESTIDTHLLSNIFEKNQVFEEFNPGEINNSLIHSLGTRSSSPIKTVDYNPHLKRIDEKLKNIEGQADPKIVSHNIRILRDNSGKQWAHLILEVKGGKKFTLEVPLAKNMIVPGSSSLVGSYVDMLFAFGGSPASPYTNTKEYLNSSEYMLRTIETRLDTNSSFFNQFGDPERAIGRLKNEINSILDNLTLYSGKIGQLILQVYNPEHDKLLHQTGESGQRNYDKVKNVLSNISMMRRMVQYQREMKTGRVGRVFIVNIDTETLTASQNHLPGIEHTARNPQTHLVQIGVSISELGQDTQGPKTIEAKRFISDHAVNDLYSDNLFDTEQVEFLRKITPGVDASTPKDEVIRNYVEHMRVKTDQAGTRAANDTIFVDRFLDYLDSFFKHSKLGNLGLNDKVVIVTKNGQQYDLPLLKAHASAMKWQKFERKYKDQIDVGSLGVFESRYDASNKLQGLDVILKDILNRTGYKGDIENFNTPKVIGSVLDHLEKVGYLSITDQVKKQLQSFLTQTHGEAVVDTLFSTALFHDQFLRASKREDFWNPVEEAKLRKTLELYRGGASLYENILIRTENGSAIIAGRLFNNLFSSANRATKGALQEFSPGDIFAFGAGSNLSKQLYQNLSGHTLQRSKYEPKKGRGRNIFRKTLTTVPLVELELEKINSNKQSGMFVGERGLRNSITVKTAYVLNSAAETEGLAVLSTDIAKQVNILHEFNINLNSVRFSGTHVNIGTRIDRFKKELLSQVIKFRHDHPDKPMNISDIAKTIAMRSDIDLATLPRGTTISAGDMGTQVLNDPAIIKDFDIKVIKVDDRVDLDIRVKVSYKGRLDKEQSLKGRTHEGSKSMLTFADPSQLINGLYGHELRTEAKWIKDGNVSAIKNAAVNKIIGTLQEKIYSGTWSEREEATKQLKLFARKLNAELVHNEVVLNPDKMKKTHYRRLSKEDNKLAHAIYGALDISWEVINEFMKPIGSTWTNERLKDFYSKFGGGNEQKGRRIAKDIADKAYDTAVSKLRQASTEALYSVEKDDVLRVEEECRRMIDSIYQPKVGGTVFAEMLRSDKDAKNSLYNLVFSTYTDLTISSGRATGEGFLYHTFKMSNNVVRHITESKYVTQHTKDMVLKNRVYYRDYVKRQAKKTMDNFKKNVFAGTAATGLTLDEIRTLLSSPGKELLRNDNASELIVNELKRNIEGTDNMEFLFDQVDDAMSATIEKYRDSIVMLNNELDDPEKFREYKERLIKNIISNHRLKKITQHESKFLTYLETNIWSKLAEDHKGIFRISSSVAGLPNVFDINLNKVFNNQFSSKHFAEHGKSAFKKMLEDMLKYQQTNNIDGPVISIDGDNIKLRELFLPAHSTAANIADSVAGQISRETAETASARRFLQSVYAYSDRKTMSNSKESNINANYDEMIKFWVLHLSNLATGGKSLYGEWISSQIHLQQFKSKGAEMLHSQAFNIKRNGGFRALLKHENKIDEDLIKRGDDILERILNADVNTVFVTESGFKNMKIDVDGKAIKVEDHFKNIGLDNIFNLIIKGEEKGVGFVSRYPNEPQGFSALVDMVYQVIPNDIKKYLLMDDWSAHTFDVFTQLIKMDHDGDAENTALANFRNLEEFKKIHKEISNNLTIRLNDIANRVEKVIDVEKVKDNRHIGKKIMGFDSDGLVHIYTVDKITKKVSHITQDITIMGEKELADLFATENMGSYIAGYSSQLPDFLNSRILGAKRIEAASTAATRDIMGIATNSILKADIVMRAGLVKNENIISDFYGDMKTGLGKFLQDVTGVAKNPSLEKIISLSRQLEVLQGRSNDMEAIEQFKDSYVSSFENEARSLGAEEYDLFMRKKGSFYEKKKNMIDTYVFVSNVINRGRKVGSIKMAYDQLFQEQLNLPTMNVTSIWNRPEDIKESPIFSEILESFTDPKNETISLLDEFQQNFINKTKLTSDSLLFKNSRKFAKYGAIGAAVFLAANFFRPNQLSSSSNPLDMFVDIENNINSDNNIFYSDIQLPRNLPLDMVNTSFSKQAFIRTNNIGRGRVSQSRSRQINYLLNDLSNTLPNTGFNIPKTDLITNVNYTSDIGTFGSNNITRRSKYNQ